MHVHIVLCCVVHTVCLLHVSATPVALLRKVHYKGYITELVNQWTNVRY